MQKPDNPKPATGLAQQLDELDALLPELTGNTPPALREEVRSEASQRSGIPVLDQPVTAGEFGTPPATGSDPTGYSPQEVADLLDKMELRFISDLDKLITELKDRLGIETPHKVRRGDPDPDDDG